MWANHQTQRIDYDDDDDLLIPSVSVMEFMVFASELLHLVNHILLRNSFFMCCSFKNVLYHYAIIVQLFVLVDFVNKFAFVQIFHLPQD